MTNTFMGYWRKGNRYAFLTKETKRHFQFLSGENVFSYASLLVDINQRLTDTFCKGQWILSFVGCDDSVANIQVCFTTLVSKESRYMNKSCQVAIKLYSKSRSKAAYVDFLVTSKLWKFYLICQKIHVFWTVSQWELTC